MDNFRRCQVFIELAARLESQFIVFPEMCFTGYSFLGREEVFEIAETLDGPTFRVMKGVALELKSYVTWGFPEIVGDKLYNSAAMISPQGKLVMVVRKVNLWGNDFLWATPGETKPPVVKTELGNVSIVICRDIRGKYPLNIPRTAEAKEPPFFGGQKLDLVAAPANWGKGGFPATTWMSFVAENKCALVVANRWGEEFNDTEEHGPFNQDFGHGGSTIIERDWKIHIEGLKFSQDCLVTACMETNDV
jgi:predicted amidohydrolase